MDKSRSSKKATYLFGHVNPNRLNASCYDVLMQHTAIPPGDETALTNLFCQIVNVF